MRLIAVRQLSKGWCVTGISGYVPDPRRMRIFANDGQSRTIHVQQITATSPPRVGSLLYRRRKTVPTRDYFHQDSVCGNFPAGWGDFLASSPG